MISGQCNVSRQWNGELTNSPALKMDGVTQLDDLSGAKMVNTALLPNSISVRWFVKNILSSSHPFFLYTLFLTKESTKATEPIFNLWNISLFSRLCQMPLTPLLELVTEDNFLGLLNLQTSYSSSTWQSTQCGVRLSGSVCSHELERLFSA